MSKNTAKVRATDFSFPVHHQVNQPAKGYAATQRVSPDKAAKSSLRLVTGAGRRVPDSPVRVAKKSFSWRKTRLPMLDAGFFMLALGAAAAMWWSVTVK
jgi:hypothetical protein